MIDKSWNVHNIVWRPHETDAFVMLDDGGVAADFAGPPAWTAWKGHWGPGDAAGPSNHIRPSDINSCGFDPGVHRLGMFYESITAGPFFDALLAMKAYRKGPVNPGVSAEWSASPAGGTGNMASDPAVPASSDLSQRNLRSRESR